MNRCMKSRFRPLVLMVVFLVMSGRTACVRGRGEQTTPGPLPAPVLNADQVPDTNVPTPPSTPNACPASIEPMNPSLEGTPVTGAPQTGNIGVCGMVFTREAFGYESHE